MSGSNEDRVRAGLTFLDAVSPGWRDRVDVDALDVSNALRSPDAQALGHHYERCVGIIEDRMHAMGMLEYPSRSREDATLTERYHDLSREWKRQLRA